MNYITYADTETPTPVGEKMNQLHSLENKALKSVVTEYDHIKNTMLQMGFTVDEIEEMPEDKLQDYGKIQSFVRDTKYMMYYLDKNGEEKTKELEADKFDYQVSKKRNEEQRRSSVETMSANGKLKLTKIWIDDSDHTYNSTGYLMQDQHMAHVGNNEFFMDYRWEWVIRPDNTKKDVFYVLHKNTSRIPGSEYYVYKYDFLRYSEIQEGPVYSHTYEISTPNSLVEDGDTLAYVVDLKDREASLSSSGFLLNEYAKHRGYVSFRLAWDQHTPYLYGCAGYFHCRNLIVVNPTINTTGYEVTVSPAYAYVREDPGTEVAVG